MLQTGYIMAERNNPYDELRYYSKPFSYTSIALLEGNATLWGLTTELKRY